MNGIFEKFSKFLNSEDKKENRINRILIIGIIGIALIFFSEIISFDLFDKSDSTNKVFNELDDNETEKYTNMIETELEKILSKVEGVGKVSVMISVEGSIEYVYVEEEEKTYDKDGESINESHQNSIVIIEKDGDKEALVKKILKPKINGVIVVCDGGNNPVVCEKVYQAVATVLNISTGRVCVAKG